MTCDEDIAKLKAKLVTACLRLHAVGYMCPSESQLATKAAADVPLEIGDEEDLRSSHASKVVDLPYESLKALSSAARQLICTRMLGQANNKNWFTEKNRPLDSTVI